MGNLDGWNGDYSVHLLSAGWKSPVIISIGRNNLWPGAYPHVTADWVTSEIFEGDYFDDNLEFSSLVCPTLVED
ncbi:unnamed protein product [Lathyrus sativus]|nr:unnamed protein product [Lathyrus sativus]